MTAYGWPFDQPFKMTCAFGVKGTAWKAGYHSGLDLVSKAAGGTGEVRPVAAGTVLRAAASAAYGNYVSVTHPDGYISLYAHLATVRVKEGDPVGRETVLGEEGDTGNVTGRHLHLEVHAGAYVYPATIDPADFIKTQMEAQTMEYNKQPTMHAVTTTPAEFGVIKWCKGKRTTEIQNYACGPFQASGTVPVGNVVASSVWLARNPALSTIWVTKDNIVGFGKTPPANVRDAVSGLPLLADGRRFTLKEAIAQGWDTSPLYATTHALLGLGGDGNIHYFVFTSLLSGAAASWKEIQDTAAQLGMRYALLLDGGGSTILDVDGVNKIASAGNRQLAAILVFRRSQLAIA